MRAARFTRRKAVSVSLYISKAGKLSEWELSAAGSSASGRIGDSKSRASDISKIPTIAIIKVTK